MLAGVKTVVSTFSSPWSRHKAQVGSVEDWAIESLLAARGAYQDPATGQRIKPGTKLSNRYQEANLPIAKQRPYQAGARMAMVLDEAYQVRWRDGRIIGSDIVPYLRCRLPCTAVPAMRSHFMFLI